jgi:hypothetical protein
MTRLLALIGLLLPVGLSAQAAGVFAARPDVANGQSAQTDEALRTKSKSWCRGLLGHVFDARLLASLDEWVDASAVGADAFGV